MKKIFLPIILVFLLVLNLHAQAPFSFETHIARGGIKFFHIGDTISVTFTSPIDTAENFQLGENFFTNLDLDAQFWFSQDLTTVYFIPNFEINKYYYIIHLGLKLSDGTRQSEPLQIEFATASVFTGETVSGNVKYKEDNAPAENALVALLPNSLDSGSEPTPAYVTLSNSLGEYSLKGVKAGTYYPVAIVDMNQDGEISLDEGDILGKADSIVVGQGGNSNVDIVLQTFARTRFARAKVILDSLRNSPIYNDLLLYYVLADKIDSTGKPYKWKFLFVNNTRTKAYWLEVSPHMRSLRQIEQNEINWFKKFRPLGDSINVTALPDSFLARVERRIGKIIRKRHLPDSLELNVSLGLGDIANDGFRHVLADTNGFYWGLRYRVYNKNYHGDGGKTLAKVFNTDEELNEYLFLADYKTGEEVAITGVEQKWSEIPQKYLLEQNYPNPFNPSTKIKYSIPNNEFVTLKIYNILGSEVTTLVNQKQASGNYEVSFDASDLTSGIYFYQISSGKFNQVRKMMLVK